MSDNNFRKNFFWNILGTGFNSFNSLFLMIIVTRINGVDEAGIFTLAFSTACILYVIGTYSGRIYQVTETDPAVSEKDYLACRVFTTVLMIVAGFAFVILRGYNPYKSLIFILLCLYKALEAFSDVLYGVMQKHDSLYQAGRSYFIKSLFTLSLFLICDIWTKNLVLSIIVIIVAWILIILFYDIPRVNGFIKEEKSWERSSVISILRNGFFVFANTFMGIYMTNASKYAIDDFMTEKYQTIFGILIMPTTALTLFGQFILHPYLNNIAQLNEQKKYKELNGIINKVNLYIFGAGVLGCILAYTIGIPILNFLYGVDISEYRIELVIIIAAATLYNIGGIYFALLTTLRKTLIQFIMYLGFIVIAFFSANGFTKNYGITGSVYAYALLMIVYFISYFIATKIIIAKQKRE